MQAKSTDKIISLKIIINIIYIICIILILGITFHISTPTNLRDSNDYVLIDQEYPGFSESTDESALGKGRIYTFQLRDISYGGESLAVWLVHHDAVISIGDEVVYDSAAFEESYISRSPGRYWAVVPISESDEFKTVTIRTVRAYSNLPDYTPEILLSSSEQITSYCIHKEWEKLLASLLCITFGGVFILLTFLLHTDKDELSTAGYMGLYICLVGLYRLLDMPIVTLIFNSHSMMTTYLTQIAFLLIPYVFYASLSRQMPHIKVYGFWSVFFALVCLGSLLMQVFGLVELRQIMDIIYVFMPISYATVIGILVFNHLTHRRQTESRWVPVIYVIMSLSYAIDYALYLIYGHTKYSNACLYTSLIYGLVSGFSAIRRILDRQESFRQKELELSDQRGAMLLSQIRPHFIYNTMNTIYSLCDMDVALAKQAIHDFAGYLRLNFQSMDKKEPIAFSTELEHAKFYLSIEQIRFGDELAVKYDIQVYDFKMPALTLQPIVENAVRHGLRGRDGQGNVTISTYRSDGINYVRVEDDGVGFDTDMLNRKEDGSATFGIAIYNVRSRIEQMCGGTMDIDSRMDGGTRVTIQIPEMQQAG